jgi:putative ABC transport system permease protein
MTFAGLILHNVLRRRLRAVVTAIAVAIGVTAVLALGVLTSSLRQTAVAILRTGNADFSVSQKGASDVLYSALSQQDVDSIRATPGVEAATGVFVATGRSTPSIPSSSRSVSGHATNPSSASPCSRVGPIARPHRARTVPAR